MRNVKGGVGGLKFKNARTVFYYPAILDKMEKAHSGINILLYLPDMQFI